LKGSTLKEVKAMAKTQDLERFVDDLMDDEKLRSEFVANPERVLRARNIAVPSRFIPSNLSREMLDNVLKTVQRRVWDLKEVGIDFSDHKVAMMAGFKEVGIVPISRIRDIRDIEDKIGPVASTNSGTVI